MVKLLPMLLLLGQSAPPASSTPEPVAVDSGVDVVERLNEQVPLGLHFTDSSGKDVQLKDLVHDRPVVLTMVYYSCPVLCGLLLQGLSGALKQLEWKLGKEFDVVTVSMDAAETTAMAAEKKRGFTQAVGQPDSKNWSFLTGKVDDIDSLSEAIGFRYQYVPQQRQFAHVAALVVLTPQGKVSRYLYGVEFPTRQLQSALFEAADGRVGTSFERVLLRCWRYDPRSKKYELWVTNYFRAGGVVMILLVGGMLSMFWRRELRARRTV